MKQPLFDIRSITVKAGSNTILSIANFEIHRGIVYSITGQVGSGKTAFLNALSNPRSLATGRIVFDGLDVKDKEFKKKFEEEVIYLPQLPIKASGTVEKYMLKHIKIASWSDDDTAQRLKSITGIMSLTEKLPRKMKTLSPGERRWIDLAVCTASDSKVLIIDELEQHTSYDELDLLKRQLGRKCKYEGTTIILSTLNLMNLRRLTGISVTFDRGHIAGIRSVREHGRGGSATAGRSGERPRRGRGQQSGRGRRPTKSAGQQPLVSKTADPTPSPDTKTTVGQRAAGDSDSPAAPKPRPRGRRPRRANPKPKQD